VSFLLDTNILSAHLKRPSGLTHRFVQHTGRLYASSLSLAELYVWAFGRSMGDPLWLAIDDLLSTEVEVVEFDGACAHEYGRLRVDLKRRGVGIDNMDLLIAATAVARDATLVTHNTAHFAGIPGLRLEDWLER